MWHKTPKNTFIIQEIKRIKPSLDTLQKVMTKDYGNCHGYQAADNDKNPANFPSFPPGCGTLNS